MEREKLQILIEILHIRWKQAFYKSKIDREVGIGCLEAWKKNGKGFSLQWYSSEKKWSLLYFKKGNFQHKIEEENPSTLTTLRKDYCLVWFEVFSQTINTSTDIRYHIGRMQTVIGLYSYLRVGITSATKKMQVNLQKKTQAQVLSCQFAIFFSLQLH